MISPRPLPSPAAERMRRCRERKREGWVTVPAVGVPPGFLEELIALGLLTAWDSEDKTAIRRALERFLDGFSAP
ncbi:MAG: hypothetical protein HY521_06920 [Proteobacteria bacterium]|nr:hypothetical protein [Pseudomonadota bacterium]